MVISLFCSLRLEKGSSAFTPIAIPASCLRFEYRQSTANTPEFADEKIKTSGVESRTIMVPSGATPDDGQSSTEERGRTGEKHPGKAPSDSRTPSQEPVPGPMSASEFDGGGPALVGESARSLDSDPMLELSDLLGSLPGLVGDGRRPSSAWSEDSDDPGHSPSASRRPSSTAAAEAVARRASSRRRSSRLHLSASGRLRSSTATDCSHGSSSHHGHQSRPSWQMTHDWGDANLDLSTRSQDSLYQDVFCCDDEDCNCEVDDGQSVIEEEAMEGSYRSCALDPSTTSREGSAGYEGSAGRDPTAGDEVGEGGNAKTAAPSRVWSGYVPRRSTLDESSARPWVGHAPRRSSFDESDRTNSSSSGVRSYRRSVGTTLRKDEADCDAAFARSSSGPAPARPVRRISPWDGEDSRGRPASGRGIGTATES